MARHCTDQVVGDILAGWRYDISGITRDMRGDYEQHFAECLHCRQKQRLHRTIDVGLIVLATFSAVLFLVAFGAIRYFDVRHAILLQIIALGGFAFSALMWVVVAIATPAPVVMAATARLHARKLHDRLPDKIRERLPQEQRH